MKQPKERQLTVMAYMVGASNLDSNGFADLEEMKKAGSTSEVAITAQFSRGVKRRQTKRYYLRKNSLDSTLAGDVGEDLGETNTADPKALKRITKRISPKRIGNRPAVAVKNGEGNRHSSTGKAVLAKETKQ